MTDDILTEIKELQNKWQKEADELWAECDIDAGTPEDLFEAALEIEGRAESLLTIIFREEARQAEAVDVCTFCNGLKEIHTSWYSGACPACIGSGKKSIQYQEIKSKD